MHRDVFDYERSNRTRMEVYSQEECGEKYAVGCKETTWAWGRVDLGSVVYNFDRYKRENRNFSLYTPTCCHDGEMVSRVVNGGWKDLKVHRCLYSHNPTPWAGCRHELEFNKEQD